MKNDRFQLLRYPEVYRPAVKETAETGDKKSIFQIRQYYFNSSKIIVSMILTLLFCAGQSFTDVKSE